MHLPTATLLRLLAAAAFLAVLALPGRASAPAILTTAIAASVVEPQQPTVVIAADRENRPVATAELRFALQALPGGITLDACAIRLVMADDVPGGDDNGVVLQVVDQTAAKPGENGLVAAIRVPPGTPKNTAVVLRSLKLCSVLQARVKPGVEAAKSEPVLFLLRTSIREGRLVVFGAAASARASDVPRLLLTYRRAAALPGDAAWSQIRRDAQHSGRSAWKTYDPDGRYAPTQYVSTALGVIGAEAANRGDIRQSPILYGGKIIAVLDAGPSQYRLVSLDRSGRVLDEAKRSEKPKFLAAGGPGRLYYVTENRILDFDLSSLSTPPQEIATAANETILEAPTVGADGSLYVVTQRQIRAYSPSRQLLWQYPTGQDNVGAVALGADQAVAYVVFGGETPRLVALDSATGDCRWEHKVAAIDRGPNDPMPTPVVAGSSILLTRAFPASDTMYVFGDDASPVRSDRGELVGPPPPASCRASAAPKGLAIRGETGDHMAAPVAGPSDDAYYVRGGSLCWSRDDSAEVCSDLRGCSRAEATNISLLIGDSSGGASDTHFYGLAAASKQLFFISARWLAGGARKLDSACLMQPLEKAGPNLILGPDGTLYNSNEERNLQAIVAKTFPAAAQDELMLTAPLLGANNDSLLRAPRVISTATSLNLPADTDLILVAGERIVFRTGLRVATGARLRARVGF